MKKTFQQNLSLALLTIIFMPSLVYAHTSVGHTAGFTYGLSHPLGGIDHILAMLAVGIWAAQTGGRAVWSIPLTFVSIMILGSVLGMFGVALPFIEPGIVMSVLILGVLISAAVSLPLGLSMAIVGLFAVFHGYAHGTEIPNALSGLNYSIGFVFATSLLHLSGIGASILFKKFDRPQLFRYAGGVITIAGIYLVFA
ncbi:MAG: urease accessory protein UreJ [Deltaproteobacteria bacterium GWC2_42_11]|nr:MAG: urease accessory protein UreJ [Deltaproteobacteria bacterium GWC2_42_11]HBO84932.1 urease accessory protein UreJ [Deltaproteobacteria bacterium]